MQCMSSPIDIIQLITRGRLDFCQQVDEMALALWPGRVAARDFRLVAARPRIISHRGQVANEWPLANRRLFSHGLHARPAESRSSAKLAPEAAVNCVGSRQDGAAESSESGTPSSQLGTRKRFRTSSRRKRWSAQNAIE